MKLIVDIPDQIYKELTETAIIVTEAYPSTIERALTESTPYEERKTGKWILWEDCEGKTRTCTCPICGDETRCWHAPNYCSNCGARLEVEE